MDESRKNVSIGYSLLVLIGGLILAFPASWALSYLAFLPTFLGLFFFALLGLVVGAFMYRLGTPVKPWPVSFCVILGVMVSVFMWGMSVYIEYHGLTENLEKNIRMSYPIVLDQEQRARIHQEVPAYIDRYFSDNYPPGGFIGYVRWAATNGRLEAPRVLNDSMQKFRLSQKPVIWIIRVALSLVFTLAAILSQTLGLSSRESYSFKLEGEKDINSEHE